MSDLVYIGGFSGGPASIWIDDVVAWKKTDYGGRQNNLFRIPPPPACESRYGLCE